MVERVAKAIAMTGNGGTWDDWYNEEQRDFHRKRARAAIEAMRDPTDAMKNVEGAHWDYGCHVCGGLTEGWYKMIDEALK